MTRVGKLGLLLLLLTGWWSNDALGQIRSGKIVYERKTNLFKKFKEHDVKDWLRDEDRLKVDMFELLFNDSLAVFKPQESNEKERLAWATNKNTVYQNLASNQRLSVMDVWGEKVYVSDTLSNRRWKITNSTRNIAGFDCRKAIWEYDDSTRIYAWYAEDLVPGFGPETFNGLPGTILGLATEDGGVIYFAKSVVPMQHELASLKPSVGRNKVYPTTEIKAKLEKDFSRNTWGKAMIKNLFGPI